MAKVVACIIARTVSNRLPLKVLRNVWDDYSMLEFLIKRVCSINVIDEVYLCTSAEAVDDILEDAAKKCKVKIYRGSADAVIERMLTVGEIEKADVLIRITGDNPLTSIEYIPQQLVFLQKEQLDYVRIIDIPIGATPELFTYPALVKCSGLMDPTVSEYLMLYMFEPNNFRCGVVKVFNQDFSEYSLTVDTKNDLIRTKEMLKILNKEPEKIRLNDIVDLYSTDIKLPALKIIGEGMIKLPHGREISYSELNKDMSRRKQNSKLLKTYE